MTRFYYARTKREVEIPDDIAHEYEGRKHYTRLDPPDEVPEGTIAEVLEWVGDDEERRKAALLAEEQGKQRTTLLDVLAQD